MTKEKKQSSNLSFAKSVYEFMSAHISSREMKAFMIERLAIVYDIYPTKRIEDHKAYFKWLETHNEG